jgi:hypothetical protein
VTWQPDYFLTKRSQAGFDHCESSFPDQDSFPPNGFKRIGFPTESRAIDHLVDADHGAGDTAFGQYWLHDGPEDYIFG